MQDESVQLREFMAKRGLNQVQLARQANVSQSTVSRALRRTPKHYGRARHNLFTYARITEPPVGRSDKERSGIKQVLAAFNRIWDGSDAHAAAVASVIDALEGLRPVVTPGGGGQLEGQLGSTQATPKKSRPE